MSGDLPLAAPARPQPDLWLPERSWWDIYFAVVAVGTAVQIVGETGGVGARAGALALLAGLAAWYLAWGRGLMRDEVEDWRGYAYEIGVLALFVPAVALSDSTTNALFGLCPQAYMVMRALPATVAVTALTTSQAMVFLATSGDTTAALAERLPNAVVIIVVSAVLGTGARAYSRKNQELARAIDELDSSRAEVARLSHEAGVAAERQRLAGEIHDTIAQGLSLVVMLLGAAATELERDPAQTRRRLELAANTARENLREARALVAGLTPSALTGSSLAEALARLVERFRAETLVDVRWALVGAPRALPTPVEVVLLRAAQESLANVRKHADARTATVNLRYDTHTVVLKVSDDGRGFSPSGAGYGRSPSGSGYGLAGMRTRVEQISGALRVDSRPGAGTNVRVEVTI